MNRAALCTLVWVAAAQAQVPSDTTRPNFYLAPLDSADRPTLLDPSSAIPLQRRISLQLAGVPRGAALSAIARAAGVTLVYETAVMPVGTVRLSGNAVTLGAALSQALLGAGIDVFLRREGTIVLIPKSRASAAEPGPAAPPRPQAIAGRVLDRGSRAPVPGAAVLLLDPVGVTVARATTGRDGQFTFTSVVGARSVRARMIGFRPYDVELADSARAKAAARLSIEMDRVPVVLESVIAQAENCRGRPDPRAMAVWEQAQFAFLGAEVARGPAPARIRVVRYQRTELASGDMRDQAVAMIDTVDRAYATRLSPEQFQARGIMSVDPNGVRRFYGLDGELLTSDAFRRTHCFSVAPADHDRPNQIGIAFVPSPGRDSLIEVAGIVWLDRSPLALRAVEYRYQGLDGRARRVNPGGSIEFRTASNGVTFVSAWEQRIMHPHENVLVTMGGVPTVRPSNGSVSALVDGGRVLRAQWPDGSKFTYRLPSVSGTIVDKTTGMPIAGVKVELAAAYRATTGADGRFVIEDVYPGPYTLNAFDAVWGRSLSWRERRAFSMRDKPLDFRIPMPSRERLIRESCNGSAGRGPGVISGSVLDADGKGVVAQVTVMTTVAADALQRGRLAFTVQAFQMFNVCGLVGGTATIVVEANGRRAETTVKTNTTALQRVNIRLPR